jgi:AraC family transcriptional regulator
MRRPTRRSDQLASRVKAYLAEHADDPVRLRDLSRAVGVPPAQLAYSFQKVEKVSITRYALRTRMERAASRLGTSDDLARLAVDLGFASHSHFSTAFLRWAGCAPSIYRARIRAGSEAPCQCVDGMPATGKGLGGEAAKPTGSAANDDDLHGS